MKPPPFRYHDPDSVEEAIGLLGRLENARLLAGGQSLMPMLNMRFVLPDHLVDLARVEALRGVRLEADRARIGAMTVQRDLERDAALAERLPLVAEALRWVGHRQTRNRGTLGGSLCHLDPAAELPAVCAVLDAVVRVRGPGGERQLAFADFPLGYMTPAIEPDEMLVGVELPLWPRGHGHGFAEFARRHGDYAIALAAVQLALDASGRIARAAVAIGGVGPAPVRVQAAERALLGEAPTDAVLAAAAAACREVEAMDDVQVPGTYRRQLAGVMARRALADAVARASAQGT
ncbi:MAG: FAD binding domain-containing protein [Pseudomonadota bacterium]|jgi:carbon-monoxide dehydrogenase medium subunit